MTIDKLKTITSITLSVLGALWLIVEVVGFFGGDQNADKIRSFWWIFLLLAAIIIAYKLWPRRRFSYLVDGRDISVELVIGDVFHEKGPIIVGSNTRFETSPRFIANNSVQGRFTSKFCRDIRSVNDQIRSQSSSYPVEFGTTVTVRGDDRIAYFCAIADMNDVGVARSNMENLRVSLGGLWVYLSENAEKCILNIPVLGSGYSRITEPREIIIQEIVLSFLAAITDSSFCDGIRIVVYPKDVKKYGINIDRVTRFMDHHCQYAVRASTQRRIGSAEE